MKVENVFWRKLTMKNEKYKPMMNLLVISLNILIAFGIIAGIITVVTSVRSTADGKYVDFIVNCIIFFAGTSALIYILYNLRKILKSVIKEGPFTMRNVNCLNKIAGSCFVITFCYLLNFFYNNMHKQFSLIVIDQSGIKTDTEFLIFFFAGFFVLILAQVYRQAVEVKEENDFTI